MKEILALIEKNKQEFAQLPFFEFLQNQSINPRQRLAFAPCFAPFVMGFGELNKYVWREEPTNDPIQSIINKHTYEDDAHWVWFLEDINKLGFDISLNFSESLKFIWSNETKVSRHTIYELYRYSYQATPIEKLVIIESIEAIADIFLSTTTQVTKELILITNNEYRYFGSHHFLIDSNHSMHLSETDKYIANIQLTDQNIQEYFKLVEKVFDIFVILVNELYIYAKNTKLQYPFNQENIEQLVILEQSEFTVEQVFAFNKEETDLSITS